ncbi:transposase, partial [Klebsiella pneumoniae]|uniref:transposase n=4 Tax=Bacteria TaxID=2 RepID=UPI001E2F57A1
NKILQQAIEHGLVNMDAVFMDSTHIKASANKKKYEKVFVEEQTKTYKQALEEEINKDRQKHGLKPLDFTHEKVKLKEIKISTTDPDSGMINKNEKEHQFGYSAHIACDKNGIILSCITTPANVHDSMVFE